MTNGAGHAPRTRPGLRFPMRAAGVLLIAGSAATWVAYRFAGWGVEAVPVLAIAAVCAFAMGWASYATARRGIYAPGRGAAATGLLLGGMVLAFALLVAEWLVVASIYGAPWRERAILATLAFYALLVVVKVVTLHGEVRESIRAQAAARAAGMEPASQAGAHGTEEKE